MLQIVVGCDVSGESDFQCDHTHPVLLQYNKDPLSHDWHLLLPQCMIDSHERNMECMPYKYSSGSIYAEANSNRWKRIALEIPPKAFSRYLRCIKVLTL